MTNWSNRHFPLWPLAVVAVLAVPLALGGVSYRKEAEYGPASHDRPVAIHIQNRGTSWGSADYVGRSVWGAPFDVYVNGEAPEGTEYETMILDAVVVSDGTAELRRVEQVEVPLERWSSLGATERTVMANFYVLEDALPATPPRITVRATGRLASKAGAMPFDVLQSFDLVKTENLHVGSRTFPLK